MVLLPGTFERRIVQFDSSFVVASNSKRGPAERNLLLPTPYDIVVGLCLGNENHGGGTI